MSLGKRVSKDVRPKKARKPEFYREFKRFLRKEEEFKFHLRMASEAEQARLAPISDLMYRPMPQSLFKAAQNLCTRAEITSSIKAGHGLARHRAGSPTRRMLSSLYAVILLYPSVYTKLNRALREKTRQDIRKYLPFLRVLLEAMDALPRSEMRVWRSIDFEYEVGHVVTWWGVSSCTSDERVARKFLQGGAKRSLLCIYAKTACDISEISPFPSEVLLAPGTRLLVTSKRQVGNITEHCLEEVDRLVN